MFQLLMYLLPSTALGFEESSNKIVILSAIDNLVYTVGGTRTGLALENIGYVFEDIRNSGNRVAVPQVSPWKFIHE